MVRLLGPQDRLLTTIERQYPARRRARARQPGHADRRRDQVRCRAASWSTSWCGWCATAPDLAPGRCHQLGPHPRASARAARPSCSARRSSRRAARASARRRSARRTYVDAIDENTIVFGIGPAGTGKTYLAMAKAVQALQRKEVERIILTRPAVEAGERLGFLPGTLTDKIDPYLRPLYDALNEMMDPELVPKLLASGTVEVAPLAYMRGRTLNNSFVVLDEAQNTTPEQMKMFLTRLGFGSKMVVTGDITQVDLPGGRERAAARHPGARPTSTTSTSPGSPAPTSCGTRLVGQIVDAYTKYDAEAPARALRAAATRRPGRPQRPPETVADDDRDQQRVRRPGRRDGHPAPRGLRPRPAARAPGRRARDRASSTRPRWSSCTCSGWTSPARPTC